MCYIKTYSVGMLEYDAKKGYNECTLKLKGYYYGY